MRSGLSRGGFVRIVACVASFALLQSNLAHAEDAERENTKRLCTDGEDNDGDGQTDCADPDCQVFKVCQAYQQAEEPVAGGIPGCPEPKREIQSTPKMALGAVLIPMGLLMLGGSIPLFLGINYSTDTFSGRLSDGSNFTTKIGFGYSCSPDMPCNTDAAAAHSHDVPYLVGALFLSVGAIAAVSAGAYFLYTGLQPKKQRRARSLSSWIPNVGAGANGMSVGLSGSF